MKTRQQKRVDYRTLHEGSSATISNTVRKPKAKWSKSTLFKFTILEETETQYKVHWDGWSNSYDQWIQKQQSVDIPIDVQDSDAYSHLTRQLYIQVGVRFNYIYCERKKIIKTTTPKQKQTTHPHTKRKQKQTNEQQQQLASVCDVKLYDV